MIALTWLVQTVRQGHNALRWRACVRTPALEDERLWETYSLPSFHGFEKSHSAWLVLEALPALTAVASGYLQFVGPRPCSRAALKAMDPETRANYLNWVPGILGERHLAGEESSEEMLVLLDGYTAGRPEEGYATTLVARFFRALMEERRLQRLPAAAQGQEGPQ